MKHILIMTAMCLGFQGMAQTTTDKVFYDDSTKPVHKYLDEITVVGRGSKSDYQQMPEVVGTSIYAGKKNALIVLDNVQGNVVTNNMRQVVAKIPGIHVWESDPSGIQIGIAARGLSPNRSWEFNVRQNGYDISADPFGYPEAYYNPQLQAVQRIEVVRGQGALQYGPQFGGLVNYILRNGSEIKKPFEFETQQTVGSNNLFNSYNAIGGNTAKVHYYTFFDHRNGDGWRENSRYYTNAGYGTITYRFTPKFSLTAETMVSHIRSQQAGGLTDAQFEQDAKQSLRSRNWFDIKWTTPALIANYQFSSKARLNTKLFAVIGDRSSVGFMQSITTKDSINAATGEYNPRTVQVDNYRNYGLESRFLSDYDLAGMDNTFSGGIRLYTGSTHRKADGTGTTGSNYTTELTKDYLRDIDFGSQNAAVFIENIFRFSDKFLVVPGIRYEWLEGSASGINGYEVNGDPKKFQDISRSRSFLLAGVGAEFHPTTNTEFYANYTQAYRPIQFANLQAPPTTDVVDPNMEDSKGYNIDLGYRGKLKDFLQFDVSGYILQYNNRIGVIAQQRQDGTFYNFRTNVGNSTSKGFESYIEFNPVRAFASNNTKADLILFTSYGYTNAEYGNLKVITKQGNDLVESNLKNKKVENAPEHIFRGGITAGYKGFLLTGQVSHVSEIFSDANNTIAPSANGQNGLLLAYTVTDLTATYKFNSRLNIKAGVNNLFNEMYSTRRAGGYPGPGLLPADGRNFFISVGAKL